MITEMIRFRQILKNEYIFSILTRLITITVSMLQSILVARYLGAALKGSNAYISSIASVGSIIVTFGMHQAYPYIRKKYGKENVFDDYMSIIVCLYSFYFITAVFLVQFILKTVELKVAAIIVPLLGFSNVVSYVTLIENPNKRNLKYTIINILNLLFVSGLLIFTESSFVWSIIILIFADVVQVVVYTTSLRFKFRIANKQFLLVKELFMFGFLPMVALLMTTLNYKIDVIMLRGYSGIITSAQIGIYSVGMSVTDHIALVPDTLKGVLVSKLAKGADEHEVAKVCRLCFWSSIFICLCLVVVGEPLINLLYGLEYNGAYHVLLICAFGTVFIGYFKLIAQYNIINKKQVRNVFMLSISIAINIVLNMFLIPRYKLAGAAFASGVGYFLSGFIFIIWFAKTNGIKFSAMFFLQKYDLDLLQQVLKKK